MTADIKRQLLAHGAKLPAKAPNAASEPRKAPQATPVPVAAVASPVAPVSRAAAEVTHYIGPYQLNVANGTHYPGRSRCVVVGPASDELTAALVAAVTQFVNPSL